MINKFYNFLFLFSVVSFFVSCQVGLGPSVDIQAPEVEITSHQDNDSVAEFFVVAGTATDNEAIATISVDFEDADIHYKIIPGGQWQKKTSSTDWVAVEADNNNYCRGTDTRWEWAVGVDVGDKSPSKIDSSFTFTVVVTDRIGNSGKKSKVDRSVIVDSLSPSVSIYKPELFTGTFDIVQNEIDSYALKDGNVISRLMNGDLILSGRQEQSISFKALRIEFDSGKLQSGLRKSTHDTATSVETIDDVLNLDEVQFDGSDKPDVYFSKTIEGSNLREWEITVKPEEWAINEAGVSKGLHTGKHLVRVITTSLSSSNAWERKVLGYFVWYPEADIPWLTLVQGDEEEKPENEIYECYQESNLTGSAQDDDGIQSVVSVLYKKGESGYTEFQSINHPLPQTNAGEYAKFTSWSVTVPSVNGVYKLNTVLTDIYGNKDEITRYFKTSDVSAPKFNILSPQNNSSAVANTEGNITFTGTVKDDGKVTSLEMVWLNPAKNADVDNKIKFLTGEDSSWNVYKNGECDLVSKEDENCTVYRHKTDGNLFYIFKIEDNISEYSFNKTVNLFDMVNGNDRKLITQDFIFRASDGVSNSISEIIVSGDSYSPELSFDDITIYYGRDDNSEPYTQSLSDGNVPSFPKIPNDAVAVITGSWADKFNAEFINNDKFADFNVTWAGVEPIKLKKESDGTWQATFKAPSSGGTITASISDFGGNTKTIQAAVNIETAELGLARVGSLNEDGAYKAGDKIYITLEFTKNTTVVGNPKLELNNGGVATFVTDSTNGNKTPSHKFEYVVSSFDRDIEKLSVVKIDATGVRWSDSAVEENDLTDIVKVENLPTGTNLGDSRSIKIDKTAPKIDSVQVLTAPGYYSVGNSILFKLKFTEPVVISGLDDLTLNFNHNNAKTESASTAGSDSVIFTYSVKQGDNASPINLNYVGDGASLEIKDLAGNPISSWDVKTTSDFTGIIIDTNKPNPPDFGDWNPEDVIIDSDGTWFELTGEKDGEGNPVTTIEYSLDGGTNWLPYSSRVELKNNGNYLVTARQTDKAGNVSNKAATKEFTIDKGELLSRITASTVNGTYSVNTTVKRVTGKIEFRKEVKIAQDSYVILNVQDKDKNFKTVTLDQCKNSDGTATVFTFEYVIVDGDYIKDDGVLDLTGWSFTSVSVNGTSVNVSFPETGSGKAFSDNRSIRLLTGAPHVEGTVSFEGEGEGAVLKIPFDRAISKGLGTIKFEYDTSISGNEFHVPVVLSKNEYNELKTEDVIKDSYTAQVNGAVAKSSGENTKLEKDTQTKYVLNFETADTDTELVAAFIRKKKHMVEIPVVSDVVEIEGGNILKVSLGSAYALPVKGAQYKVTIPVDAVSDAAKNKNAEIVRTVTAAGVEAPRFRFTTPKYSISNKGDTKQAQAKMGEVQSATFKIDTRTPGASIKYGKQVEASDEHKVFNSPVKNPTSPTETYAPSFVTEVYTTKSVISLAGEDDYKTDSYNAKGLRIGLKAVASKNARESEPCYDSVTRTVLKLSITGKYRDPNGGTNTTEKDNSSDTDTLKFSDLKVWVTGGDSSFGPNTVAGFPLSWQDSTNFKLMAGSHDSEAATTARNAYITEAIKNKRGEELTKARKDAENLTAMYGQWWWVTWDISSETYFSFVIGDVPSDSDTDGPRFWYASDCAWVPVKQNYILYPGATLVMSAQSDSVFPYGASLIFNTGKKSYRQ